MSDWLRSPLGCAAVQYPPPIQGGFIANIVIPTQGDHLAGGGTHVPNAVPFPTQAGFLSALLSPIPVVVRMPIMAVTYICVH